MSNFVGSCAFSCGACLLRRGPEARPPIIAAKEPDIGPALGEVVLGFTVSEVAGRGERDGDIGGGITAGAVATRIVGEGAVSTALGG